MVLTYDVVLPEHSELTVPEVNLSTATLRAGSFHLGKYCETVNNSSFVVCNVYNLVRRSIASRRQNSPFNTGVLDICIIEDTSCYFYQTPKNEEIQNPEIPKMTQKENDPRKCINEGKAVTACTLEFFRKVKKSCLSEFNQYATCIDKSSGDFSFTHCRKTQHALDGCMLNKMNLERPAFGYFCEARVHDTKRPKPLPEEKDVYPDATPALPADAVKKEPRFGSRFFWMTE